MTTSSRRIAGTALLLISGLVAAPAWGQFPQPRLQAIFPAGGRAGDAVDVQLVATQTGDDPRLWFAHPGLTAEPVEGGAFRVTIAGDVPVGNHDVRVMGSLGVSNPRTFVVGNRPETVEVEPNNRPEQATPAAINTVINGRADQTADVDHFAFDGRAGRRVLIELDGLRIDSRIDGVLRLFDPEGREIAANGGGAQLDPFLDVTLPADGSYRLAVRDLTFGGSAEFVYRLTIHDGPHLDAVSPVAVAPGETATLTLLGRNLGGDLDPEMAVDGQALERLEVAFTMPDQEALDAMSLMSAAFVPAPAAGRRGVVYRFENSAGVSNPIFVATADDPVVVEREPNDTPGETQAVSPPCEVSGTFGAPDDLDRYQFAAAKGQVFWIEASAERIGSPADPSLVIQQVDDNGQARDLATADDLPDTDGAPLSISTVDAALRWEAPEDGTFQVVVSDLYGSQRGDARFGYRLSIRPERPDFRLLVAPIGVAAHPFGLTVRAGGRTLGMAVIQRRDGFNAPVRIEAETAPGGLSVDPVVIGPGQTKAPIVLSTADDAEAVTGELILIGRALVPEDQDALRAGTDLACLSPSGIRQIARPVADVWQAPGNSPYRLVRATHGLPAAIIREVAPLRLSVSPGNAAVARKGTVELTVTVDRAEGIAEKVEIAATDLPPQVPEAKATLEKDQTTATLTLTVPENAPVGVYTVTLRGTAAYTYKTNPDDEKETKVNLIEPSNPITLTIHE